MKNNLIKETINFLNSIRVHNHEFMIEDNEVLVKRDTDVGWGTLGDINNIEYIAIHNNNYIEFNYKEPEGTIDALYINQYGIEA